MKSTPYFFITSSCNIYDPLVVAKSIQLFPNIECLVVSKQKPIQNQDISIINPSNTITIDQLIQKYLKQLESKEQNKYFGVINFCSAFELDLRVLNEKTLIPFRRFNLICHPVTHIQNLIKKWLSKAKGDPNLALQYAERSLAEQDQDNLLSRMPEKYYALKYYLNISTKISTSINSELADNKLFLQAFALWYSQTSLELLSSTRHFSWERLLNDPSYFSEMIQYVVGNQILEPALYEKLTMSLAKSNNTILYHSEKWENWQTSLLRDVLVEHKSLLSHYEVVGYSFLDVEEILRNNKKNVASRHLISIHLNSNRPAQLAFFFDNLEETVENPASIEVIVNIDDDDVVMLDMLNKQKNERKFTLKYLFSPRPKSFCDLWQPLNRILKLTNPDAYFLLNISDEMYFKTKNWDTILRKYIGFFPDHIFRLRASRNKYRTYFDFWECGFSQDSIPITTKKWIDIGGNWNPCFGPDSFQQFVAFYLAKYDQFSGKYIQRDIPIHEIEFGGDLPFLGIADDRILQKRVINHINAWFISASYLMQQEAARRAALLRGHIIAAEKELLDFEILENKDQKAITILDLKTRKEFAVINYKISKLAIILKNNWRKLFFPYYFGSRHNIKWGRAFFSALFRFPFFYNLTRQLMVTRRKFLKSLVLLRQKSYHKVLILYSFFLKKFPAKVKYISGCRYRIIFQTENSEPILDNQAFTTIKSNIEKLNRYKCDMKITELEYDNSHFYFTLSIKPELSLNKTIDFIRMLTSNQLKDAFPILKKTYCKHSIWSPLLYVYTIESNELEEKEIIKPAKSLT